MKEGAEEFSAPAPVRGFQGLDEHGALLGQWLLARPAKWAAAALRVYQRAHNAEQPLLIRVAVDLAPNGTSSNSIKAGVGGGETAARCRKHWEIRIRISDGHRHQLRLADPVEKRR